MTPGPGPQTPPATPARSASAARHRGSGSARGSSTGRPVSSRKIVVTMKKMTSSQPTCCSRLGSSRHSSTAVPLFTPTRIARGDMEITFDYGPEGNRFKANVVKPNVWDAALERAFAMVPDEGPGILVFCSALNLLLFSD